MKSRMRMFLVVGLIMLAPASPALAQTGASDVGSMALEDLLTVEVTSVASKFPQELREAPASITVVTAADIKRYGFRTLADVLGSVRGLYTSYDRNYHYFGLRGFSRPGDYNTRVLLLVDGNRLNDPAWDMAPIGTDFPIDISLIDKVEVIRGPASSLYGTNALAAVINVVTRTGAQHAGVRLETSGGSQRTGGGTLSYGRVLRGDGELLLAASGRRSDGAGALSFPEFGDDAGPAVARGLDADEGASLFGSLSLHRFSLRVGAATRLKQVPTAAFETLFGNGDLVTEDTRAFLVGEFDSTVRGWQATARAAFNAYDYAGTYPMAGEDGAVSLYGDGARTRTFGGEVTLRRRMGRVHMVTAGLDVRRDLSRMFAEQDGESLLDLRTPGTVVGLYAQDEVRIRRWLLLNAGIRFDRHPSFGGHVTPRAGVVLLPRQQTAVKFVHGRAFRAPNPYELYYYTPPGDAGHALDPEEMASQELVWEEYVSSRVRTTVTAYRYTTSRIIEQQPTTETEDHIYFANVGRVEGAGVEAEIETRLPGGVIAQYSHAYARVRNAVLDAPLSNSPHHLSKFAVSAPLGRVQVAVQGQFTGARRTLSGERLDGVFLPNLSLTWSPQERVSLSLGVYNALDTAYGDPGAEEHIQQSIPQDGRTALVRARVRF